MDHQSSSKTRTERILHRIVFGPSAVEHEFADTQPSAIDDQHPVPDGGTSTGSTSSHNDVTDVGGIFQQHGGGGMSTTGGSPGGQGSSGGSNELSGLLKLLTGLVLAAGSVYFYTHDTQPNRAQAELAMLANQAKDRDVELEKEKTKQLKITAEAASVVQPQAQTPSQNLQAPNLDQPLRITRVKVGDQWMLTEGNRFIFSQYQGNDPSARVFFTSMPKSYQGSFLLVDVRSKRQAWSQDWSSEPSPDIDQFFADFVNPRSEHLILIYSRGDSIINM